MLSQACARVLKAAALAADSAKLAPHLAGLALFSLSTLYVYQTVVGHLHQSWLTLGARNHLVLQLPHSLTCFGNNTLALILSLLIVDMLCGWTSSGNRNCLGFAAALASLLPGYSVMLVFPLGLAIMAWTISGRVRRPVLTLAVFGAFAAVAWVIFRAIGLFSYGGGGGRVMLSFDHGQFIQNILLGFFPATFALGIWLWNNRTRDVGSSLFPFLCVALACLAVPTVSMTKGSPTSPVDFSIKTASLYLVAVTPFFALASAWLVTRLRQHRGLGLAGVALVCAGLVNTGAYVLQHAFHRALTPDSPAPSIALDHYRALELVARQPSLLVLIDQFSIPNPVVDPAVMLGGKRVLVASGYEQVAFPPSATAKENKALWLAWQHSGFSDDALGRLLAERAESVDRRPPAPFGVVAGGRHVWPSGRVSFGRSSREWCLVRPRRLYKLLENPLVYSLSQSILLPGAGWMLRAPYERLFGQSRGLVLDIGCGPALSTPSPADGRVVGLDINPRYVKQYAGAAPGAVTGTTDRLGLVGSAAELPLGDGRFDESRCMGLFHHLRDDVVRSTVAEMCRVVKSSGRVIIIDNVWPLSAGRRPLAWATRRLDRGEWVRSEAQLKGLVESGTPARWTTHRITYTLTGLELLLMEGKIGDERQ